MAAKVPEYADIPVLAFRLFKFITKFNRIDWFNTRSSAGVVARPFSYIANL
jgi:hypothetical protein